ncbi:MAG: DUF1553 domain-containing protein [Pirellulales bacterium]|nr:DUF1553 domain-containing protein [Pirellulales bacterium]
MRHVQVFARGFAVLGALVLWMSPVVARAESVETRQAAAQVDRLLAEELFQSPSDGSIVPAEIVDDETFLRRVSLDLVGEMPTPEEVTAFSLDPSPDKRGATIDRLLADPRYGENWARYWRDVMLSRRSDERALISSVSVVEYLTKELNAGARWDDLAREFITAKGELHEHGATALIASQWGQIPETAAEISRVFLGVQIQCAQCHDHPTDRWKREQFHELAAFFPRLGVRALKTEEGKRRGFEIFITDRSRPANAKNKKPLKPTGLKRVEHFMPDLDDPAADGTLMQPVFFVTGEKLEEGLTDAERRSTLAEWMTSSENPWFAKALVNRVWAEMVGEGFYEPIDDLGPDRECSAPQTMDYLAEQFVAHDHDLKWLLRTIASTEAYQRTSQPRRNSAQTPFVANCPQRLRADQLFDSVAMALGIEEQAATADARREYQVLRAGRGTPRGQFLAVFGFDPSDPRDEVQGSIDQALMMMNSPIIAAALNASKPTTQLARLLEGVADNDEVVVELYLRTLAREPSADEMKKCLQYVARVGDRREAFEDILWALVNSTEFLHRK